MPQTLGWLPAFLIWVVLASPLLAQPIDSAQDSTSPVNATDAQEVNELLDRLATLEAEPDPNEILIAGTLLRLGEAYTDTDEPELAIPILQRAITLYEVDRFANALPIANSTAALADAYRSTEAYNDAIPLLLRALAIYELDPDAQALSIADTLAGLGDAYIQTEASTVAIPLLQRALELYEVNPETDPTTTATTLADLGYAYSYTGSELEAVPLFERALGLYERHPETDPIITADILVQLGFLYNGTGAYAEAIPSFESALGIYEEVDPDTYAAEIADLLARMAHAYGETGASASAILVLERALGLYEEMDPNTYAVDLADTLARLGYAYIGTGASASAIAVLERAVKLSEGNPETDEEILADTLRLLGFTYAYGETGASAEAIPHLERALDLYEGAPEPNSQTINIALVLRHLGYAYNETGAWSSAIAVLQRVLELSEVDSRVEALGRGFVHVNLGTAYNNTGATAEAIPHLERALGLYYLDPDATASEFAFALLRLGFAHNDKETYAEAIPILQRALELYEGESEITASALAYTLVNLGIAYNNTGATAEAIPHLKRAVGIFEEIDPDSHAVDIESALRHLGFAYNEKGAYAEATPVLERALVLATKRNLALIEEGSNGDPGPLAYTLRSLGYTYTESGKSSEAISILQNAITLYDGNPNIPSVNLAHALRILGYAYNNTEASDDAVRVLERALDLYEEDPGLDPDSLAATLSNLGFAYNQTEAFAKAIPILQRALELYEIDRETGPAITADALARLGYAYNATGAEANAIPVLERAVGLYEEVDPDIHAVDLAINLVRLGFAYNETSPSEAILHFERAVGLYEEMDPDTFAADIADALARIGYAYNATGAEANAIPVLERAVGLYEEVDPDTFAADIADALARIGNAYNNTGAYAEAIPHLERAVAGFEGAPDSYVIYLADTRRNLGTAYNFTGSSAEAIPHLEQALAIYEGLGPDTYAEWIADTLAELGYAYKQNDLSSRAIPVLERALDLYEVLYQDTSGAEYIAEQIAITLGTLGDAYILSGFYAEAISPFERAIGIYEGLGPDTYTEWIADDLKSLGYAHNRTGAFRLAIDALQRARNLVERHLGRDDPALAPILFEMAQLGAFKSADAGLRALEHAIAVQDDDHTLYRSLHSVMTFALNDWLDSGDPNSMVLIPATEQLVRMAERVYGPDDFMVAYALEQYATALSISDFVTGENDRRVIPTLERALNMTRQWVQAAGENSDGFRVSEGTLFGLLDSIAFRYGDEGNFSAAQAGFERLLANTRALTLPEPLEVESNAQVGLGMALYARGHTIDALHRWLEAEEIDRNYLQSTISTLPERWALATQSLITKNGSGALDYALSAILRDEISEVSGVWNAVLRRRPLLFDELASRHSITFGRDPETLRLTRTLQTARAQVSRLQVQNLDTVPEDQDRQLLLTAIGEREQAEANLAAFSASYRTTLMRNQLELPDVVATLSESDALVAFTRYRRRTPVPRQGQQDGTQLFPFPFFNTQIPSYLAFVQVGSQPPVVVPIGPEDDLVHSVDRWHQEAALQRDGAEAVFLPTEDDERAYREAGVTLRQLIWDPLIPHLAGAERVFVVPDGVLNTVNLASLPIREDEYLLEQDLLIHYVANELDLVTLPDEVPTGTGLLALGGATFDASLTPAPVETTEPAEALQPDEAPFYGRRATCREFSARTFSELPGTLVEIDDILNAWTSSRYGQEEGIFRLAGTSATERAFKQYAPGKRVLHIATHGFFLSDNCVEIESASRRSPLDIVLTATGIQNPSVSRQDNDLTGPSTISRDRAADPLLLSGLALAAANRRNAVDPGQDDGILTAEEVAAMDLSGVEWAVLSACETAAGADQVTTGESLRRAFQAAGVQTLIMSLWDVADAPTQQWMTTLYQQRFEHGVGTAEAVRHASLQMLRDRRDQGLTTHPFFWAPFIAVGDWR